MKAKFKVRNIEGGRVLQRRYESESALLDAAIARRNRARAERREQLRTEMLSAQGIKHDTVNKI